MVQTAGEDEQEAAAEAAEAFLAEELPEATFGAAKAGSGMWASCLRVMHPTEVGVSCVTVERSISDSSHFLLQGRTLDLVQFDQNEAAFR